MDRFRQACWLATHTTISRLLISNTDGRLDGAEKAERHMELCRFYVAANCGINNVDDVDLNSSEYKAVYRLTKELTDNLDTAIGFPIKGHPDYDKLEPVFFEKWHELATTALRFAYCLEYKVLGVDQKLISKLRMLYKTSGVSPYYVEPVGTREEFVKLAENAKAEELVISFDLAKQYHYYICLDGEIAQDSYPMVGFLVQ